AKSTLWPDTESRHAFCGRIPARPTSSSVTHGPPQGNAVGRSGVKLGGTSGAPVVGARVRPSSAAIPAAWSAAVDDSQPILRAVSTPPPMRAVRRAWRYGKASKLRRLHWYWPHRPARSAGLGMQAPAPLAGATKAVDVRTGPAIRRAATPGHPADVAGTRALGRTPREQRNH